MEKRAFKNKVYSLFSQVVKAMANSHRLEIIDLLAQGDRTVEEIARETEMSIANTSQHLQVLKSSNLVEIERVGNYIRYRLSNNKIYDLWANLRNVGFDQMADTSRLVNDYHLNKSMLEAVSLDELLVRMKTESLVLLDIRPPEEFNAGHIFGSLSTPLDQLNNLISSLPKDKVYIAYCRGPLCLFADDAIVLLSQHGFNVRRLSIGYPDWKIRGLPVQSNF